MTDREVFFQIVNREMPTRFPSGKTIQLSVVPGEHSMLPEGGEDWFGVYWHREPDGTQIFDSMKKRIETMESWKEVMPAIREEEIASYGEKAQAGYDRENCVQIVAIQSGHFERMQSLVGFEDALTAFYEYPDETMDFFNALTDYKIEMYRLIKKYYNPDIISPHDDWGMNRNMFFSPDVWREFIRPQLQRMVDATHEMGMLYEQHTCGYITQIYGDMVECGVDMGEIQAVNDLQYIKDTYGNAIVLRGCMNGQILGAPGITPEQARKEVRRTLEIVAKNGGYLAPNVWGTTPEIMAAIREEYDAFAEEYYR